MTRTRITTHEPNPGSQLEDAPIVAKKMCTPHIGRPTVRRTNSGFTLIEVMMSICVLLIGTTALVGLQQVAARANIEAREKMTANQILENWMARLKRDALAWSSVRPLNMTQYLDVPAGGWQRPATTEFASAAFNYFGQDMVDATGGGATRFCVGYRIDPVVAGAALRASVIVFWPRHRKGADMATTFPGCEGPMQELYAGTELYRRYQALVSTTLLRRQP